MEASCRTARGCAALGAFQATSEGRFAVDRPRHRRQATAASGDDALDDGAPVASHGRRRWRVSRRCLAPSARGRMLTFQGVDDPREPKRFWEFELEDRDAADGPARFNNHLSIRLHGRSMSTPAARHGIDIGARPAPACGARREASIFTALRPNRPTDGAEAAGTRSCEGIALRRLHGESIERRAAEPCPA